jgi:hypothetical protein
VDDPHVGALTPVLDADWVVRVGEGDVVIVAPSVVDLFDA